MTIPINEYAFIGDRRTGALVSPAGSIDWLCLPDFDAPACFAALLGVQDNGRWLLGPVEPATTTRDYVGESLVLQTVHETRSGSVRVTDLMPEETNRSDVLRRVEGLTGTVRMRHEWRVRPWYGRQLPLVVHHRLADSEALVAVAGPDRFALRGSRLPVCHANGAATEEFEVAAGDVLEFDMTWQASHTPPGTQVDLKQAVEHAVRNDEEWVGRCAYEGPYRDQVRRSLLVLRHLTHADTGGIVAALTTSLPEDLGGGRNWDYRYVWLRDSALTVEALLRAGYSGRVDLWRNWLVRAIAGDPSRMQIMYRVDAGHDLPERELDHLRGYADSRPVRIGNGAVDQRQTDVLGEVLMALDQARDAGIAESELSASLQVALVDELARHWRDPDHGIWEIRGPVRYFTQSRVMTWASMDIAIRAVEVGELSGGDVDRWRRVREEIRAEIDERGVSRTRGCFVQHYDTEEVDASLLLLPHVGFCAPSDPRFLATVRAIEEDLLVDGLVLRYRTGSGVDGLAGDEHPFVLCSFWLVSAYTKIGRLDDARRMMDLLIGLAGPLGLYAEELDADGEMLGNYPQAFSHLGLIIAAHDLRDALAEHG